MPSFFKYATAALAAAAPFVSAQTHSDCNPMKKSCPPNKGTTESHITYDFTKQENVDKWKTTGGKVKTGDQGAEFTVGKKGDAPTIDTPFYFFFGELTVKMKAAPGTGIVSSIVMESDDLDEIDWEGLGSKNDKIETNYFGKGDTTTYDRETYPPVSDPQGTWHEYKIVWAEDHITWKIDDKDVRTVKKADAKGGSRFPQTPMRVRIGVWAGGDPSNGQGTIEWAGGSTDYSKAPFTMYVKEVQIKNDNPAKSYEWTDKSGDAKSIKKSGATSRDESSSSSSSSSDSSSSTDSSSSASSTMATTTKSSGSKSTGSGSSSAADSSSSGGSSSSDSASASGSGSPSSSGSGSSTSSSASPSSSYNAAANMAATYVAPLSLLAILTAFFQL
ncbi:hypothetical protein NUU61_006031 [Penicillium alfredii]|uniref:Crh-like protein n=1 Tax=Penicillium alfredii TaxID=1506179 RepID=A0A9W9F0B6_9EURO|nr:uncharacterized protein NUU61_006031 [Penicillium alfredii]KAJ5091161.1 hypothetical protein NUU61_006031 [Penicillium alfredii]